MSEIIYKLVLKPEKKNSLHVGDWVKFLLCDVHRHCTWQINRIKQITPHGDGFMLGNGEYYEFQNLFPFDLYIVAIGEEISYDDEFIDLVDLGSQLRQIHLLESDVVEQFITQYPIDGDNVVTKPRFVSPSAVEDKGNVYINETQYFTNVPVVAWNFYIGGYQPAQKWLKDRKDRTLSHEDIFHYQKIIVALTETDRLMKEIDKIEV